MLARYRPYFNTPIIQLTHAQIGQEMQRQRAWKAARAAISAYVQDGQVHVVNTTGRAIDVPLTGTSVGSLYGGQRSGWTNGSGEPGAPCSRRATPQTPPRRPYRLRRDGGRHAHRHAWHVDRYADHRAHAYQWQRCNIQGAACESIPGATATTYTTQAADKDKRLRVVVSAANWISSYSQAQSAVTEVVEPTIAPASTGAPALSGTAAVGQKLTCSQGTWTGSPAPTFAYQWKRDGANIAGATDSTYTVVAGDAGHALTCTVTATNAGGSTSASSNSLTATSPPANTGAPALTGTALTGQTLTCSQGTWTGSPTPTYAYQWKRAGANIAGATASTYLLVAGDVGQAIKCTVTATNSQGSASADSNSVVPSAATPNPTRPPGADRPRPALVAEGAPHQPEALRPQRLAPLSPAELERERPGDAAADAPAFPAGTPGGGSVSRALEGQQRTPGLWPARHRGGVQPPRCGGRRRSDAHRQDRRTQAARGQLPAGRDRHERRPVAAAVHAAHARVRGH